MHGTLITFLSNNLINQGHRMNIPSNVASSSTTLETLMHASYQGRGFNLERCLS